MGCAQSGQAVRPTHNPPPPARARKTRKVQKRRHHPRTDSRSSYSSLRSEIESYLSSMESDRRRREQQENIDVDVHVHVHQHYDGAPQPGPDGAQEDAAADPNAEAQNAGGTKLDKYDMP